MCCSSHHHYSSRWQTVNRRCFYYNVWGLPPTSHTTILTDGLRPWCLRVCVPIRIVCVWRVRRSHFHQCSRASTVTPMSILYTYTNFCTGVFMHIIEPTAPLHGGWVSEMRTFRKLKICRNCSILTPKPYLHHTYTPSTPTYPLTPTQHLPPYHNPLNPWYYHILTTFSLHFYLPMHIPLHTRI